MSGGPQTAKKTTVNYYLVKFMEQSYLNVKWMKEAELEEYSYKSKQKIRRYQMQKDKKKALVSYYPTTAAFEDYLSSDYRRRILARAVGILISFVNASPRGPIFSNCLNPYVVGCHHSPSR